MCCVGPGRTVFHPVGEHRRGPLSVGIQSRSGSRLFFGTIAKTLLRSVSSDARFGTTPVSLPARLLRPVSGSCRRTRRSADRIDTAKAVRCPACAAWCGRGSKRGPGTIAGNGFSVGRWRPMLATTSNTADGNDRHAYRDRKSVCQRNVTLGDSSGDVLTINAGTALPKHIQSRSDDTNDPPTCHGVVANTGVPCARRLTKPPRPRRQGGLS